MPTLSIMVRNSGHSVYVKVANCLESRTQAKPAGQIDAGLSPREHPRDGTQILKRLNRQTAASRTRTKRQ
jgi:hypothetical protein